jgi:hypothetical protein
VDRSPTIADAGAVDDDVEHIPSDTCEEHYQMGLPKPSSFCFIDEHGLRHPQ